MRWSLGDVTTRQKSQSVNLIRWNLESRFKNKRGELLLWGSFLFSFSLLSLYVTRSFQAFVIPSSTNLELCPPPPSHLQTTYRAETHRRSAGRSVFVPLSVREQGQDRDRDGVRQQGRAVRLHQRAPTPE